MLVTVDEDEIEHPFFKLEDWIVSMPEYLELDSYGIAETELLTLPDGNWE